MLIEREGGLQAALGPLKVIQNLQALAENKVGFPIGWCIADDFVGDIASAADFSLGR